MRRKAEEEISRVEKGEKEEMKSGTGISGGLRGGVDGV